jgi:hypothetical protein
MEKEIGVELSHINFLEKTLKNLRSAVKHLRKARKNTVLCGMTSRRSERSFSPTLRGTANVSQLENSFQRRQLRGSRFTKTGKFPISDYPLTFSKLLTIFPFNFPSNFANNF